MKINLEIDPKSSPNISGEILRALFFAQADDVIGCYSTFELNTNVLQLEDITDEDGNVWHRAKSGEIEMRYFWDGDGILIFFFSDGSALINDDCKKLYRWEYRELQSGEKW